MIVFGVPVIRRYDLLWRLFASMRRSNMQPDRVIVIDNGGLIDSHVVDLPKNAEVMHMKENVGCSGAWNLVLDACNVHDVVLISNDDIELSDVTIERVVDGLHGSEFVLGHGFSLFGMHRALPATVGFFDENFFPAYFEDNDYTMRMKCAGIRVGVVDGRATHGGSLPGGSASLLCRSKEEQEEFSKTFEKLRSYYVRKWGGYPGEERFKGPFNGKLPSGWRERPVTG